MSHEGTVQVPADEVVNWVGGAHTPEAAMNLMAQGGIPVTGITQGGQITHIRFEHVWARAWVDYFPGRGMTHQSGDSWIPMDASFKLKFDSCPKNERPKSA
ncbi:hypothetical protein [Desulfatitalea alkaliphila]|uniref:Uncharacterized protein n=1 Tax=Desulfatitalea alkaliphila TaxID=2929485 RepID=A0AA41UN00_9BACT|nr:hypothetical protein [Desulfatitalea alkaliphila]MCJ8503206.1 hypothetical protein [Desulfatitalea alkaliphila]